MLNLKKIQINFLLFKVTLTPADQLRVLSGLIDQIDTNEFAEYLESKCVPKPYAEVAGSALVQFLQEQIGGQ